MKTASMFDNFRDKIQNVQSLSSGLLDLSIGEKKSKNPVKGVNLNAGFKLLSWHQAHWAKCHQTTQENAELAEKVAHQLEKYETGTIRQQNAVKNFISLCETLPQLEESISTISEDLNSLKRNILCLEEALDELKIRKELENLIQFKVDQKYRLARYKDYKISELESLKSRLAADHAKKIANYEKLELLKLKERQLAYQAAFEEDLNFYKAHGKLINKTDSDEKIKSLEEIEVEPDEEDKKALDQFLEDKDII